MSTESGDSDHLLTESKPDSVQHDETMAAEIPDTKTDQSSESTTDQPELVESEKSTTDQPERVESEKSTTDQPELVESEKSTTDQPERVEGEKSTEIQFYGSHFHQLIDPEPSVASLFKLQMTRCVERTVQCHALLREADKLIRAESVAADALGKLGMEYADTNLKVKKVTWLGIELGAFSSAFELYCIYLSLFRAFAILRRSVRLRQ